MTAFEVGVLSLLAILIWINLEVLNYSSGVKTSTFVRELFTRHKTLIDTYEKQVCMSKKGMEADDLSVLLVYMANNDDDAALRILRSPDFVEVYTNVVARYQAGRTFEAHLKTYKLDQLMPDDACRELLKEVTDYYKNQKR